jgi:hypothetical protein
MNLCLSAVFANIHNGSEAYDSLLAGENTTIAT